MNTKINFFERLRWLCQKPKYTKHAIGMGVWLAEVYSPHVGDVKQFSDTRAEFLLLLEIVYVLSATDFDIYQGIVPQKLYKFWDERKHLS